MRAIVGAILILAASVLVGAGIISHGMGSSSGGHAIAGYLLAVIGTALLMAGPLKRGWDAIPVDELQPGNDR
jgi:uncharacterized membrane protein